MFIVAVGFERPNGLSISDLIEKRLYIVDSGKGRGVMRVFAVDVDEPSMRRATSPSSDADGIYDELPSQCERMASGPATGEAVHSSRATKRQIARPHRVARARRQPDVSKAPSATASTSPRTSSLHSDLVAVSGTKTF